MLLALAVWCVAVTKAGAAPQSTPEWDSDAIRAARPTGPVDSVAFTIRRDVRSGDRPVSTDTAVVTLTSEFIDIASAREHVLDDFILCRELTWGARTREMNSLSCYAGPAFRLAELGNRQVLRAVGRKAGLAGSADTDAYWAEQELAVQAVASDPLVATTTAQGTDWRLGDRVVVHVSASGSPLPGGERAMFARYLARQSDLHPQVRQALIEAGRVPDLLEIQRFSLGRASTEVLTITGVNHGRAAYPLPPHLMSAMIMRSRGTTIEAAGLRQALGAIAETASPAKLSFNAMIDRLRATATANRPLETLLALMALTQQYVGTLQTDPASMQELRALAPLVRPTVAQPEAVPLNDASLLAGSTDPSSRRVDAARYLAGASGLDTLPFGTFRYVTFANLLRMSGDIGSWDKSITARMPSIPDCYWKHIAAYPWASPAYKDLGDFWYSRYDMPRAWEAWDLGRAIDPEWKLGPMQSVLQAEEELRRAMPDNF